MFKYLAKRIGRSILTLFIIVTLVFCLLRLMPVEGYFANYEKMTEAQIQAGLQSMGLLDPLPVQIGRFWVNMLHGDLGVSHIYKVNASVTSILAKKLPISIQMGVYAMLLSLVIGIPMGLFMGRFKSRWPDKIGTAIIVLIQAVPAAVYYLYIQMYGTTALNVGLLFDASNWKYWVLPVCSMSLGNVAFYAMWLRRYMVDESNKDYVRLARAKGVSENKIALKHIFRNAMVPLVQYIPSAFLNTVVGSIYIERDAGYRCGIHMKEYQQKVPAIVIGGRCGSFLGEYQAGGTIVVLGIGWEDRCPVGNFCGTGMHGGRIYLRTTHLPPDLPAQVVVSQATEEDISHLRPLVEEYCRRFQVEKEPLLASHYYVLRPNTKNPYKQLYVNN